MVKLRVDMRVHTEKFQFFNVKYHAIIEIVECESGRVAKKLWSAGRLCEYAGTRPFPNCEQYSYGQQFLKQKLTTKFFSLDVLKIELTVDEDECCVGFFKIQFCNVYSKKIFCLPPTAQVAIQ